MKGRVIAVDPGEKRIGIALSDPTGMIARPLLVLNHRSRSEDAESIVRLAQEQGAAQIVVGVPLDVDGSITHQGRRSENLAEEIRGKTSLPVILWDESGSTQAARASRIAMGVSRRKRIGHHDAIAATVILQSYLDAHWLPDHESSERNSS